VIRAIRYETGRVHGFWLHCLHWQEGDGDCCRCGEPNWCGEDGDTPEALAQFERRELTCVAKEAEA
jgi:hypothetical protein